MSVPTNDSDPRQPFPIVVSGGKPAPETQAKRQASAALATSLAAAGWILPIVVLLAAPLFVVLHFSISDLAVWWWWIPLAAIYALALLCTFYAFANLPRAGQSGRGWVIGQLIAALSLLVVSGSAFGVSALAMSFLLWAKSDEGRRGLGERRRVAEMTQQERINEQRMKLIAEQQAKAKQRAIERQKRDAEQAAEWARNEEAARRAQAAEEKRLEQERIAFARTQRDKQEQEKRRAENEAREREQAKQRQAAGAEQAYAAAIQQLFLNQDNGEPLPDASTVTDHAQKKYSVRKVPRLKELVMRSEPYPTDQPLFDETFTSAGHAVRRLSIPAQKLAPMLACEFFYQQPTAWLLEKQGRLIEIALPAWQPRRTWDLGVRCHFINSSEPLLLILGEDQVLTIEIHSEPYNDNPPRAERIRVVKPARGMCIDFLDLETATSTALHVHSLRGSCDLQELRLARKNSQLPVLPSYLGRDVEVAQDGTFHAPQQDGIYRSQVNLLYPDPDEINETGRRLNHRCAQFDFHGEKLRIYGDGWETKKLKWTKVVPGGNLELDKFATLHHDLLATCSAEANLILFDRTGQQLSSHTWPGAGRTVNIQGLPSQNQFVVFTENHVYFVAGPQKVKPLTVRPK